MTTAKRKTAAIGVETFVLCAGLLGGLLGACAVGGGGSAGDHFTCSNPEPARANACVCSPTATRNLVSQCDASTIEVPADSVGQCCRDYVVVGTQRKAYQCVCAPIRCAASATSCGCVRLDGTSSGQSGTAVANCDAFVAATPATICCAKGSSCACGTGACSSLHRRVASCGPSLTCDSTNNDYEPVAACH